MEPKTKKLFEITPPYETESIEMNRINHSGLENIQNVLNINKKTFKKCLISNSRDCDSKNCITETAKLHLLFCQFIGVYPMYFDKKQCKYTHKWISISSFINAFILTSDIIVSIVLLILSAKYISKLGGTDYIAILIMIMLQLASTIFVYMVAHFSVPEFCEGWQILHDAIKQLGNVNYNTIRRILILIPACLLAEGSINSIIMRIQNIVDEEVNSEKPPFYIEFLVGFATNFIPNFITCSFAAICCICGYTFYILNLTAEEYLNSITINDRMKVVTNSESSPSDEENAEVISKLRQIHEDLCNAVRLLTKAYGLQLCSVIPTTVIRFIWGIYGVLATLFGFDEKGMSHLIAFQGVASVLAGGRVMLVILCVEFMINKNKSVTQSLLRYRVPQNSKKVNQEIDVFLNKLGLFPLEVKGCGVMALDLSFLSSAIPNVITYVLVLLQFRQGDDATSCTG